MNEITSFVHNSHSVDITTIDLSKVFDTFHIINCSTNCKCKVYAVELNYELKNFCLTEVLKLLLTMHHPNNII